jgi:CBS domain-containing protein
MLGMKEMAKAGNHMTRDPVSLSNTSTLQEAIEIMANMGQYGA